MGPLYLSFALGLAGQVTKVDVATGADLRWSGGMMAVEAEESSQPSTDLSLILSSGMRLANERTSFVLAYRPTYYYQLPNAGNTAWPLFLHNAGAQLQTELSERTTLTWSFVGNLGQLSYSSLLRLLPNGTAATAARMIPVGTIQTTGGLGRQLSENNLLTLNLTGAYSTNLGREEEEDSIPTTGTVVASVSDQQTLDLRNALTSSLTFTHTSVDISQQEVVTNVNPHNAILAVALTWNHELGPSSGLTSSLGASADGLVYDDVPFFVFPTFMFGYQSEARAMGTTWSSSASTGMRGFVDPLLGTFTPQAFLTASVSGQHRKDLQSQTSLLFMTSVKPEPISPPQYETTGSLSWTLSYDLTPTWVVYGGASWQLRAAHLSELKDELKVQNQLVGILGLRLTLGTGQSRGGWL